MGLGPGHLGGVSLAAYEVLTSAPRVWLRTRRHPVVEALEARGMRAESFDALYEAAASFDELYTRIAEAVMEVAAAGDVVYAVPGSPTLCERTLPLIKARCEAAGIALRVVPSVSAFDAVLSALQQSVDEGAEVLHAPDIARLRPHGILPLLVFGLYDSMVASEVKLSLMDVYPDEHPVAVVRAAGVGEQEVVQRVPLFHLDRVPMDHLTSLYVPPMEQRPANSFQRLVEVMDALRDPGGCPWDAEQTHQTLKKYLLEEAYEFFDAIDEGDDERMADELGDLLLQVVFHARIAKEEGRFHIGDSIRAIVEKLVRRHPHVFGSVEVRGAAEVLDNWERIKAGERLTRHRASVLDGVPRSMPALARAYALTRRAARVGFDWRAAEDVLAKLAEESAEVREALAEGDAARVHHEVGDLLFVLVNLARKAGVDPEDALAAANARFSARFRYIEAEASQQGQKLEEMSLEAMDALWNEAKQLEKE
ncbi:MAG: nucleoside triphosphate pyrophosphohydrolase [Armatimonadota bacterium]|nr:nucleoside triphosphate pyrophosphohydrolase [Armatimonadota bacterium]